MKMSQRMMESHRDSARREVASQIRAFEAQIAQMKERLEQGEAVDATILQHTAQFAESVGTYNTFKLVLELLDAEAELETKTKDEA